MKEIVLAIDVMGGDFGPEATIEGVVMASKAYPNVMFRLFGNKNKVLPIIKKNPDFKKL